MDEAKTKKFTIQLSGDLVDHLEWLANSQGISQVEAIRKAIATESYIRQAIAKNQRILIQGENDIREVVFR